MSVAQGAVWSYTIGPIIDIGGNVVSNAVSAGHLTVTALYDSAGTDQKTGCTIGAHLGNGVYPISKTIPSNAVLGNWTPVATWNNTVEPARRYAGLFQVVPAGTITDVIGLLAGYNPGNVITTRAPISVGGVFDIFQKTDFHAADGKAIPFTTTDAGTWPDLTGATVTLSVDPRGTDFGTGIEKTGNVITPTGATKLIQFELDAADTENVPVGLHPFQVRATLASGAVIPLATGRFNIIPYIYGAFD